MAFSPLTSSQPLSFANNSYYRNANREAHWGKPVYYTPGSWEYNTAGGYPGPRYAEGYNYTNSSTPQNGNCTWWCCGRLQQTIGTSLPYLGNGSEWASNYQRIYGGTVKSNANDINPGDIICLSDGSYGHVMFVETVDGDTITISQSAWSTRSVWNGMACLVTTYRKSEIYAGASINMYRNLDSTAAYETVVGILKTGQPGPTPPTPPAPTESLTINIDPSSYNVTMNGNQDYVDFTFDITISGIPANETVSGGNTYPGLSRVYNTGWTYTNYTVSGTTYRNAYKRQTLRYKRESTGGGAVVRHMYFNITKSTGTISSDTRMYITVKPKSSLAVLAGRLLRKKRRGRYNVTIHL